MLDTSIFCFLCNVLEGLLLIFMKNLDRVIKGHSFLSASYIWEKISVFIADMLKIPTYCDHSGRNQIQLNLDSSQLKGLGFCILTIRSLDYNILWKTLREKETLLVTSNVSNSLNVFLFIVSINFLPFYDYEILSTANFFIWESQKILPDNG